MKFQFGYFSNFSANQVNQKNRHLQKFFLMQGYISKVKLANQLFCFKALFTATMFAIISVWWLRSSNKRHINWEEVKESTRKVGNS